MKSSLSSVFPVKILCLSLCLAQNIFLTQPLCAADGNNPGDYVGPGDWDGTPDNDHYTNSAGATVNGSIDMLQGGSDRVENAGTVTGSIIGGDTNFNSIINSGTAGYIYGSANGSYNPGGGFNSITNSGTAGAIVGSFNFAGINSGGSNSITNSGTTHNIWGSHNWADTSSGDSNSITNSGTAHDIYGSYNEGDTSSGGSNSITNSGTADDIYGSNNMGDTSSGGSNSITNSGTVGDYIYGSYNEGDASSGGSNSITNSGTVGDYIYGSYNEGNTSSGGSNSITNSGIANLIRGSFNSSDTSSGGSNSISNSGTTFDILGSSNAGDTSSGGSNSITNSGIANFILGSDNLGDTSSGGSNSITNSGTVNYVIIGSSNGGNTSSGGSNSITNSGTADDIYGSYNGGDTSSGGSNSITNSGTAGDIFGSYNDGNTSSGGSNSITNSGTAGDIFGSYNDGNTSSGGSNTINNYGTIQGDIYGSVNSGTNATSTGNTISNWGTVLGDIWGSRNDGVNSSGGDDIITNYGRVDGNIYGADGNDTIIIGGGSSLGGVADGGDGTDILGFNNMGNLDSSDIGVKYINFENLGIYGGSTTLIGTWNFPGWNLGVFDGTLNVDGTVTVNQSSVHSGNLIVNGRLYSDLVTIHQDGLLGGSGNIFGNIINYGTIAPGNSIGTMSVNSSVTFMEGSTYLVEIASNGAADLLDVSGTVTISGGTVRTSLPRSLYTDGRNWTIISAGGGVTGRFSQLTDTLRSQTLSLHLGYGTNKVAIILKRKPFTAFASTDNQKSIGATFDSLVSKATGSMASLIISMDFDMSSAWIQSTLAAMNPEMYTAFEQAGLQSSGVFDQVTELRQSERRLRKRLDSMTVAAQGESLKNWNLWARFIGSNSDRDAEGDYLGNSQKTSGLVTGIDRLFNDQFLAGLSLASTSSDLEWEGIDHNGSLKGIQVGLYASIDLDGFFVDGSIGYGDFDNSGGRLVSFSRFSGTVGSDFNSNVLQGRLTGGYDYQIGDLLLSPLASIRYASYERDGFTEQGGDYLTLNVDESEAVSLSTSVGLQLAGLFEVNEWKLIPKTRLMWLQEHETDAPTVSAHFADYNSVPFTVSGLEPVSDYALVDLGLTANYKESFSLFFNYLTELSDGFDSQLISFGLAWRF